MPIFAISVARWQPSFFEIFQILFFEAFMKTLILLALLSFCQLAFADWSRIAEKSHPEPQQYIDLDSVKQTGPMAIMRRVWELRNYSKPVNGGVRSIKRLSEYDCLNHRHRVIQELWFTDPWAQGQQVATGRKDEADPAWRPIKAKSINKVILDEMCPHENDG